MLPVLRLPRGESRLKRERQRVESQERRFQFKKRRQKFVKFDNVAATFAMGVHDPTPAVSGNGAAIAHDQPEALSLSATISQYLTGSLCPKRRVSQAFASDSVPDPEGVTLLMLSDRPDSK